ncbi:MAG: MaoC family dehydratase [Armatimonadota bacterium]|nr:MaoC family dehydratase [Armatimonadota bacterium]MDR7421381.1 MaoC family dehydratase [Armatimonadota bacterium]MDR7453897.1 MaoC family dehydratase [Armatimonadota bacterium]MDR7456681.1 MaoC family dehydratase [Armatimonadota bacterium]MDR7495724.1 MaoC family dehydratase [Armatimonadota bacterium]
MAAEGPPAARPGAGPAFVPGQRAAVTRRLAASDIDAYAALVGDHNPLHLDEAFAARSRFGGRIAHGLLTAGLISTVLGMHLPGPGGIYVSQSLRFLRPVRPGDAITATAEVTAYDPVRRRLTVRTTCTNQRGETVLDGEAVLLVEAST